MNHGGARRKAGRPKGSANRVNNEARLKAAETGVLPLDYMLTIMRDDAADRQRRDDMAKAAAPYVHARLASIDANVNAELSGTVGFTWLPPQG